MALAPPRCPRSPAAGWPSAGKRGKGGLRKVRLAGAREGGRRGAPRRRRATCTCYVAAASARAAGAGARGVTRGKRGGAGSGVGVCARRGCGHLRAPRRARTPASGALAGARVGPGGGGARQAARPAPSPYTCRQSSVRPRHLLCPRVAMCHVKGPPRRTPAAASTLDPQGGGCTPWTHLLMEETR
jgi:hypothetical protein